MNKQTHDIFPIRLKGNRRATVALPVDLTKEDSDLIIKHISFIAECTVDHNEIAAPSTAQKDG